MPTTVITNLEVLYAWERSIDAAGGRDRDGRLLVARDILQENGLGGLAAQLRPRPAGAKGKSFNPNTCGACSDQADWRVLDDVITRALHDNFLTLIRARVEVKRWREIIDERTYVIV